MKSINIPTVPLDEAIDRVTRFRDKLVDQVPETNIPRAVLIPIDDILAIVNKFSRVDGNGNIRNELQGLRAYFAIKESDQALPDDVTALIVPVDMQGNDIITTSNALTGTDDSDIYDFTKPCPDQCDPESPLFID